MDSVHTHSPVSWLRFLSRYFECIQSGRILLRPSRPLQVFSFDWERKGKKREALKLGRMKERSDTRGDTQNSTLFSSKTVTGGEWLCTSSFLGCSLWPYQFVKNKDSGMGKKCHVLLVWFDFLFFIVGNIRRPQIRCIKLDIIKFMSMSFLIYQLPKA